MQPARASAAPVAPGRFHTALCEERTVMGMSRGRETWGFRGAVSALTGVENIKKIIFTLDFLLALMVRNIIHRIKKNGEKLRKTEKFKEVFVEIYVGYL